MNAVARQYGRVREAIWATLEICAYDWNANTWLIYGVYGVSALVACQHCTEWNLVYRVYYSAFYAKRSLRAIYREYHLVNLKYKLPACPKKLYKSCAGRGNGRGIGGAVPPSAGGEISGKKGGRGRRGSSSTRSVGLVST